MYKGSVRLRVSVPTQTIKAQENHIHEYSAHSWTVTYDPSVPALEDSTGFRSRCTLTISPFTFRRKNREAPGYAMSSILLLLNLRERDKPTIFDRRRKRMKQGYTQLPKRAR